MRARWIDAAVWCLAALAAGPGLAAAPVQVMVLGTYHFGNPGQDLHNAKVDDVLTPQRQAEVAAVVQNLARFAPQRVVVEMNGDASPVYSLGAYHDYLAGRREGRRNEIDQIGFRLARQLGHKEVFGIDAEGDFPFDAVQSYAQSQGRAAEFQASVDALGAQTREFERLQAVSTVGQLLRRTNEPQRLLADHGWYLQSLRYGRGAQQPGARLVAAWAARNLGICARLVQLAQPGERLLLLVGSGHAHLLRRCVLEMPGWQLIEPGDYLPD